MIPREYSSGGRQRLGGLSKQGNPLLRFLWGEAGAHAVRRDPDLQRFYRRKLIQKGLGKASVAVARKLGIRLWIMLGIKLSTTSSVVVDRSNRKAVVPVRDARNALWWEKSPSAWHADHIYKHDPHAIEALPCWPS
jgi:hypothetical protein